MEFDLHKPGKPQTVPYDTVLEALLLKIQTEFDGGYDVARSLKNLARVDLNPERPQRLVSVLADPANRAIEQDGLNIDYAEAIKLHHLRVEALRKGLHSAYSHLKRPFWANGTIQIHLVHWTKQGEDFAMTRRKSENSQVTQVGKSNVSDYKFNMF